MREKRRKKGKGEGGGGERKGRTEKSKAEWGERRRKRREGGKRKRGGKEGGRKEVGGHRGKEMELCPWPQEAYIVLFGLGITMLTSLSQGTLSSSSKGMNMKPFFLLGPEV